MSEAARRTIPGLRASGVAASDEVGRDIRGSTTILELLRMFPDGRAECRTCGAHVRLGGRVGSMAAAWCSVCCSTSVYDTEPTRTVA
jgi:hypothetical protein